MIELSNESFDSFVEDGLVLVDVWAKWCGPCRTLLPKLEELATEIPEVKFGKADADTCKDVVAKLSVRSIPALFLFKNGERVWNSVGAVSKEAVEAEIRKHL